jgi:hypothetical protein
MENVVDANLSLKIKNGDHMTAWQQRKNSQQIESMTACDRVRLHPFLVLKYPSCD